MTRWTRLFYALSTVGFLLGLILAVFGIPLLLGAAQLMGMAVDREHEAHDALL